MASNPPPPASAPVDRPGTLAELARNHKQVAAAMLGAAAAFLVVPIVWLVRATTGPTGNWATALDPVFFWGLGCAVITAIVGGACLSPATGRRLGEVEKMRLLLLILGASIGILTALMGMALPFTPPFSTYFTGGAEEWRKHAGSIFLVALALLGGLILAFASLQLARGVERENSLMRRLLYGFSTVFTTLLLIAVLLLVNLLPYVPSRIATLNGFLTSTFDWTKSRLYSLSDRSRATLAALKAPVKAYVFLDANDTVGDEMITLLENCRAVTPKISWDTVSSLDRQRIQELAKKYQEKIVQSDEFGRNALVPGVLVIYGEEPSERAVFLPRDKLVREEPSADAGGGSTELFLGEGVLLKAIRAAVEHKIVVYFTQGNGEYELSGTNETGINDVLQQIKQSDVYDLKPLTFDAASKDVPSDADEVVVAQPGAMKPEALKALATYMGYTYNEADHSFTETPGGRKGRLLVLQGTALVNKQMVHSGLEPLFAKFGVQMGDDRVLSTEYRGGTIVDIQTSPNSPNPVAKAFGPPDAKIYIVNEVRTVSPAPAGGPASVEPLMITADPNVWVETDLSADPNVRAAQKKTDANPAYSPVPVNVGVAVSDRGDVPNDPFHASVASAGGPRLMVFGGSTWVINGGQVNLDYLKQDSDLFSSCLSWLRGEADVGAAPEDVDETKVRPHVQLNLSTWGYIGTVLLPAAHMALVVIAAGIGVWLVRRR